MICSLSFFRPITVLPDLSQTFFYCPIQKFSHLALLHPLLRLIAHGLVHAAAACRKLLTGRFSCFQGRFLQDLQKTSFRPAGTFLIDHKPDFLSRDSVFYNYFLVINPNKTFVWKFHFFYNTFVNFTFFHKSSFCFITSRQ